MKYVAFALKNICDVFFFNYENIHLWGKRNEALPKKSFVFKMKYVGFALKNI